MPEPIEPTAVYPAGWPMPSRGGAAPPPASPPPPPPPARWTPPPAPPPPPAAPIDVHVRIDVYAPGPEPEPAPPWWQGIRIAYNAGIAFLAVPAGTAYSHLVTSCYHIAGLLAVWVLAAIVLGVLAMADNTYQHAATTGLWKFRTLAAVTRWLLWTALIGTALGLPVIDTARYLITGVRP